MTEEPKPATHSAISPTKNDELLTFLFLAIVLAPIVAVTVVGGYGFVVWMTQLVVGPPGA